MAHFAEMDSNNLVLRVVVVSDADTASADGAEVESVGAAYCQKLLGGTWVQTSYNGNIRKNYAGAGYNYDADRDAFIAPKPFNSWVLNEGTCAWEAPVQVPSDDGTGDPPKFYRWDEDSISWVIDE